MDGSVGHVTVLFSTHASCLEHLAGPRHPERPERLDAVLAGARRADLVPALTLLEPIPAGREDLERVHPKHYLDRIETISQRGGGRLDPDTYAGPSSWRAATHAAGAGLTAVAAMRRGEGDSAFCAVRPPGHHATRVESMGFCIISNVAVTAAALAAQGERVLIVDYDAHHGNGTQDVFYDDPRVLFVSFHQWPLYPGTGRATEVGRGAGEGFTVNIPLPPETTGDVYLRALDDLVAARVEAFDPTWLIISAGFDAHRDDPITEMGLTAGDYVAVTRRVLQFAPPGHRLVVLEGGYDLEALTACSAGVLGVLAGVADRALTIDGQERPTSGGPGQAELDAVIGLWRSRS
jgi:acetoin utilization deacetylase AcuC-like enzyme